MTSWHIITGEYPPQRGGVADYSRSVARGLVAAGDDVVVWAPANKPANSYRLGCRGLVRDDATDCDIAVRRLPGHFGPSALAALDRALRRQPGRALLQYTPHAFGWRAMNVPLCAWLWVRRQSLDVMFHEVAYPFNRGQPLRHHVLASVQRGMAALLLRAAERVFVSIPGWNPTLHGLGARALRLTWVPIPSNLPTRCSPAEVQRTREARVGTNGQLVGHFGTYAPGITQLLKPAIHQLLTNNEVDRVLLLGRGGPEFAAQCVKRSPQLSGRLLAPGELDAATCATHLSACDVLLQPYPDGISSRRGSAMAGLALGCPIVSTSGALSEQLWRESLAVELAPAQDLAAAARALLADPARRTALGKRAATLYERRFAVEHTIRVLRSI